jgi:2-amino-4-hydroxy-6-hydroxymethyldihydropteridine diphosphokinase
MDYLCRGVECLRRNAGRVTALSAVYESEPWGFDDHCRFLNQVAAVETELDPHALLKIILRIEQSLGRLRTHDGYRSRTLDIDILLYGSRIINTPELVIPHPRMCERMFVLHPMAEIAPNLKHPVLHQTMIHLRENCKDTKQVSKMWNK